MVLNSKSKEAFEQACKTIPGGVNSPVRAFGAVGNDPLFIESGHGCHITDIDGNKFIDYVCSWGPLILGHLEESVLESIKLTLEKGTSFGAPTQLEIQLAELVTDAVPSIEKVRMVNSGTEATMSAIRLARGYTGRDLVVKFDGCYHGHVDGLLVQAGSGATTLGSPTSPGVPQDYIRNTLTIPYNDIDVVKEVCDKKGKEVACIILEPIAGNMGVIPPKKGYLEGLRELADSHGIVLIFDEVMTGFRVAYGGAQELYNVTPDLTTLGKIIGGGLPVGAYGGKSQIMDFISPNGSVYQAGTLSGNPLAMASGIATLKKLQEEGVYQRLELSSERLAEGFRKAAVDAGVPTYHARVGSMLCTFFHDGEVVDYESAKGCNTQRYASYFHGMLERGVYFAPSQFEASFVSTAHGGEDIDATIQASSEVMKSLK
ncbi:MAG: glutamate-1-semialdehyde-2,1-aminomutase [Candidatus Scalindua sp. AMX11]|nr:MAG: glutamate-1-semialdehyde-2,1-aminomutase [Candidatus Scalindua sp.]NOG84814.1 glutamate-1-semialdehyde 2,1-aminomutase [Planctomycetota bacterium]RZV98414.1 MAG: glutamate-1-semialdehyde-2,1-aminomutase [Candidatus Scalindua sp. SCAELEC01]TDE66490.1 MAG: glutamate-1-semialdehyde-2,1-aminomutase [Candidatus Scalindua sp. AMX11]